MARLFFLGNLVSTVAVLAAAGGQLISQAAPSEAEVFWRAALPDSPLPDAIRWLLRPDTDGEANRAGAANRPSPISTGVDPTTSPPSTGVSKNSPFFYNYDDPSSPSRTHRLSKNSPFTYLYDPTTSPPGTTGVSKNSPFLYNYYDQSSPSRTRRLSRKNSPFNYLYDGPSPPGNNHRLVAFFTSVAKSLSSWFPYRTSQPSPSPANPAGDNDGMVVFFHEKAVARVGETLPIGFPPAQRAPLGLLPRRVADSIPFSKQALPDVLARFGIPAGSTVAADMERTLQVCEAPPSSSLAAGGEATVKFCATSLESLVQGAVTALGTRDVKPVTSALPRLGAPLQRYTVRAVRPIDGSTRFVACHDLDYPYAVYMCHDTGKVRAYMVDMDGERGGSNKVTVAVVCHTDTSNWSPEHVSFKLLGTRPGGEPVCHLMPYGHIIWARKNNASRSPA